MGLSTRFQNKFEPTSIAAWRSLTNSMLAQTPTCQTTATRIKGVHNLIVIPTAIENQQQLRLDPDSGTVRRGGDSCRMTAIDLVNSMPESSVSKVYFKNILIFNNH